MKKTIVRWLPVFLWALLITFLSSRSDPYNQFPETLFQYLNTTYLDGVKLIKFVGFVGHMFQYAVLAFLLARALVWKGNLSRKHILQAFSISVVFAISDEIHQYFVPNRACQLFDVFLDTVGVIIGLTAFVLHFTFRFYLIHRDLTLP